jgi:ABC-type dipeptide/oligopeptide/nickel transport system permease component
MFTYTINRLLALIPILFFVSFVTFSLVRLAPGDPALIIAGGRRTTPETLANIRARYGLDQDPFTQYITWAGSALRGDLGESFRLKQNVSDLIGERLPLTLKLIGLSTVLSLLVALPLGIISALYKHSWIDYLASLIALVGVSSPVFFTGIVGVLIFSYWLGWLPAFGSGSGDGFWAEVRYLIMPAGVLALSMLALTSRMTRSSMLEVLGSDYIEAARAKGLPERVVVLKHALRNALIPVITVANLQMAFLIVGSVLVEYTFGLGGLGSLITDAIQNRDYPVVQGTVLLLTVMFVLINLVTDLLYAAIDPRIRYD